MTPCEREVNRLGLMLATALAVLVLPTAAEAYTPEGQQALYGRRVSLVHRRDSERRPRQGLPAQEQGAA